MKIWLKSNNPEGQAASRIIVSLANRLTDSHDTKITYSTNAKNRIVRILRRVGASLADIRHVLNADTVIVHTALTVNLLSIVAAKLMRRRVVAIAWDIYPHSFDFPHQRLPLPLWLLLKWIETCLFKIVDRVVVPTADYQEAPILRDLSNISILPIWPTVEAEPPVEPANDGVLSIVFGGQINPIRGVESALERIASATKETVVAHIFSQDALTEPSGGWPDNLRIKMHSFTSPKTYRELAKSMDAGLVSLHEKFPLPALPSKLNEYVLFGIPVIYVGPELFALESLIVETGVGVVLKTEIPSRDIAHTVRTIRSGFVKSQYSFIGKITPCEKCLTDIFLETSILGQS